MPIIHPNQHQAVMAFRRAVMGAAVGVLRAHSRPVNDTEIGSAVLGWAIGFLVAEAGWSPKAVREAVESTIDAAPWVRRVEAES